MAVRIFHRVINKVRIINKAPEEEKEPDIKARIDEKTYGRRVTKVVRK